MKLKDDFYHIIAVEQGEGECRCKVRMNPIHFIYKVHFSNFPVILDTAVNIKFRERMGPNEEPTFVFSKIVFEDDRLSVCVSVENEKTQYVKMSMHYQTQ